MTHKDILTKFMIEYDKANITSSYPSLTKLEIATLLDKAYLALIAQKVTGNNQRKVPFEYDNKAIEDIRPLINTEYTSQVTGHSSAVNDIVFSVQPDQLYFLYAQFYQNGGNTPSNVMLVNHEIANKYKVTDTNYPWVKDPVCYLENSYIHVLVDAAMLQPGNHKLRVTYIYEPMKFVDNEFSKNVEIEISDTMVEELINLAIVMALETVESSRLNSKSSLLPLES